MPKHTHILIEELVKRSIQAKNRAYAPYSGFRVGACVLTTNGRIYCGANIENASYSLTICAERVAIFRAVFEEEKGFTAIAISTDSDEFVYPCGACRQVISEFSDNPDVILINKNGETKTVKFKQIFPDAFRLKR